MADADEITEALATNATGPKRVRVGQQEVEQHSIADQIEAANYTAAQGAAAQPHFGLRFTKQVPGGCG